MSRVGRYWLFFVIVAVGLALSWGQVGRKTHRVLTETPTRLLHTERDCAPRQSPCAAMGSSQAVVLGPDAAGMRIVTQGFDDHDVTAVELVMLGAAGTVNGRIDLDSGIRSWRVPQPSVGVRRLRIAITTGGETLVAEFPLDR